MATLTFEQARQCVVQHVSSANVPATEIIPLAEAAGRVLASPISADRDYPPTARSVRDGFAVRAADLPGTLTVIGEVRAGQHSDATVGSGQALEIMTGAAMPPGADCVVMVEHVQHNPPHVAIPRTQSPGDNVNPQGSEARAGALLLSPGVRLGYAEIGLLASVGCTHPTVYTQPRVAILATGDEVLSINQQPEPHQIRNSNSHSLAAQVTRAGGIPEILPVAHDEYGATRDAIQQGLTADLLLLSGGVSAGKYDIVERVLSDLGAEFFFDRVLIQPGQPLVFGRVQNRFFFGLPGNPASTMVTFELFARAALELLSGQTDLLLPLTSAPLARDFRQKTGLTRFLPARLSPDGSTVTQVGWQGSGDIAALTRANSYLVTEPGRESWAEGDLIRILLK